MANPLLLQDYLFVQPLIEQRLRDALVDALPVQGIEDLALLSEANLTRTTVFVMWDGERFADDADGGKSSLVQQRWLVLLAVRNARQVRDARNESAGPLLSAVHKALAGWSPEGAHRPFKRISGRQPSYSANVALYPLTFAISLTL